MRDQLIIHFHYNLTIFNYVQFHLFCLNKTMQTLQRKNVGSFTVKENRAHLSKSTWNLNLRMWRAPEIWQCARTALRARSTNSPYNELLANTDFAKTLTRSAGKFRPVPSFFPPTRFDIKKKNNNRSRRIKLKLRNAIDNPIIAVDAAFYCHVRIIIPHHNQFAGKSYK